VVGATGFEPATPCAQGKLETAFEVLIFEQFAGVESSWAHFWDHPFGDGMFLTASEGKKAPYSHFGPLRTLQIDEDIPNVELQVA